MLKIIYADTMAKSDYAKERLLPSYEKVCTLYEESLAAQDCVSLKTLAVKGKDLIDAGVKPGPQMGDWNQMLERVLDDPDLNTKEAWLALLPELHTSLY